MKHFLIAAFAAAVLPIAVLAQAPQKFNYQAVARNAAGEALGSQNIAVKISVIEGSSGGAVVYSETHSSSTNPFGLFTVAIGDGTVSSGTFSSINWGSGAKYIKVEADFGSGYTDMGTSQLLSVPYALFAANAGAGSDNQTLSISGNNLSISNGNSVTLPGGAQNLADLNDVNVAAATNNQVLQWNGSQWVPATISGGVGDNWGTQTVLTNGTLTGNGTTGNLLGLAQQGASNGQALKWNGSMWAPANDTDAQTLSISGNQLSISNGNAVSLPSSTDAQTLSLSGTTLSISNGNNVTLPTGTTYSAGSGIGISGNTISNTGDVSNTNEIQSLSLSGSTLSISGGNSVTLPAGGSSYTAGSGISISGSNVISNTGDADNSTTNEIQTLTLSGTNLSLSNGGGSITLPSGGGGFTLPYVNSLNSSSVLFDITNTGTNAAGYFTLSNTTSDNDALAGVASSTGAGVFGYNNNANIANTVWGVFGAYDGASYGTGVAGFGWNGVANPANTDIGVYGSSGNVGVYGHSNSLNAVLGNTTAFDGVGVFGRYDGTGDINAAVYGYNNRATGTQNIGVQGMYNTTSTGYGVGVVGTGYSGAAAPTSTDIGVYGSASYGVWGYAPAGGFAVYCEGDLAVTGAKPASVGTSKGNQLLYCLESPEVWFEDFGHATLVNGEVTITLDPMFLETVFIDDAHPMIVTATPQGDCKGLYVVPGKTSFTVKELGGGTSNVSFSYRLTCKRLNYQDHRFGSDVTWGGGDTRTKYHYVAPRPVDYNEAMKTSPQGKNKVATERPATEVRTATAEGKKR